MENALDSQVEAIEDSVKSENIQKIEEEVQKLRDFQARFTEEVKERNIEQTGGARRGSS